MELPKRKQLRLQGYDYSRNSGYFLTLCTYKRRNILCENIGSDNMFKKWLTEIEEKFPGTKIDYHIIMPDHMHFVLFLMNEYKDKGSDTCFYDLPLIIDWYKTMTTNEYIKGVKSGLYEIFDKHIWQRNYYEHIIRNEEDLYEIRRYIRDNPKNWENIYTGRV